MKFDYFFYLLYKVLIKIGRYDIPERKAVVVLSLWEGFYLLIPYGVSMKLGFSFSVPKMLVAGVFLLICALNFYFYIYNGYYLKVYKSFEKRVDRSRGKDLVILLAFLLAPILAMAIYSIA